MRWSEGRSGTVRCVVRVLLHEQFYMPESGSQSSVGPMTMMMFAMGVNFKCQGRC